MNIVVLGSGGWGTALAMLLEQNRHTVTLWSHDPKKAEQLKLKGKILYFPACSFRSNCRSQMT